MMSKTEERRAALRLRLIESAERRIAADGLGALRARDLADDAGCALGAIYNAFDDMDELILRVNARTLARLGAAALGAGLGPPRERLKRLALAYADFAIRETKLWSALFEHRMAADRDTPDWYRNENAVLIQQIAEPVAALRPSLDGHELLIRARTLFSAVHGVVAISIEERFVGVAPADLRAELSRFVDVLVAGIEATPDR